MISRTLALAGSALLLTSCATLNRIGDENAASAGIGNAIVIEDASLENSRGGVLTILQSHVMSMSVARDRACPHIVLRGGAGRSQAAEALVYVDGQRMSDTCVLESLNVESIERAEVYPSGVTTRPGYRSNNGGLILIFMKDGRDSEVWETAQAR